MQNSSAKEAPIGGFKLIVMIAAACLIYALSGGIRANYGIIITPLTEHTGVGYADASFAFGVAQLMYGVTQPLWGVLALRKSNTFVLLLGIPLMMAGLLLVPFSGSKWLLTLTLGLILGSGTGALCFGMIMGAISPILGPTRASQVSGILNASCGIGSAILSPTLQALESSVGIRTALIILAVPFLVLVPIVLWFGVLNRRLSADPQTAEDEEIGAALPGERSEAASVTGAQRAEKPSAAAILRDAVKSADYRALMIGFSTCGFHMIIIQTHLVSQMLSYGISAATAAAIYTAYGVATMVGAVLSGMLCGKFHLKTVLGSLYAIRAVLVAVFILVLPKNLPSVIFFAMILGMTGDATVTPTSEIVSRRFGPELMGFLFGITFVCHQIGAFISSWLGGIFVSGGNYNTIWLIDIVVCAVAAFVSYRIRAQEGE